MDFNQLMQMAQQLRDQMTSAQGELANIKVTGEAGGGLVGVTMTGRHEVLEVKIDPKVVDPNDVRMLEDLVRAAINDASTKVGEALKSRMGSLAQGFGIDLSSLGIPGL